MKRFKSKLAFTHLQLSRVGTGQRRPRLLGGNGAVFFLAGQHFRLLGLGCLCVHRLEELRADRRSLGEWKVM